MPPSVIAIHGGAGALERAELGVERERALRAALAAALHAGFAALDAGGTCVDAVEHAVRVLEDSPLFNAGRGAVFTAAGTIELDAAIMEGRTRRAGAVAAVRGVRNPVSVARAVMERTPHVMLAADGAEAFARAQGLDFEPPSYFHSEERWQALQRARSGKDARLSEQDRHGTVGAVALDGRGDLAAATSTGGRTNKLPGRIGDSPIPGAGTLANAQVAISATGDGDAFLRAQAAARVAALVELAGRDIDAAALQALREIGAIGGSGGMIVLDRTGRVAMPFNTCGMYRGVLRAGEPPRIAIYTGSP